MNPFLEILQTQNKGLLQKTLTMGNDPNKADEGGETILHVASFEAWEEGVLMLISHGSDVNAKTNEGKTVLMNGAQSGSEMIVKALLKAGADATAVDTINRTALHWTMVGDHDNPTIVRLLLDAGCNPSQENMNGDTALEYAQIMKRTKCVQELEKFISKLK